MCYPFANNRLKIKRCVWGKSVGTMLTLLYTRKQYHWLVYFLLNLFTVKINEKWCFKKPWRHFLSASESWFWITICHFCVVVYLRKSRISTVAGRSCHEAANLIAISCLLHSNFTGRSRGRHPEGTPPT